MSENTNSEMIKKPAITAGLDIGTTKICAIVGEEDATTKGIKILGIGIAESKGLNRGVVVNIDKTVDTINEVIKQAEQQSGLVIKDLVVGIAGDHIEAIQSRGIVGISSNSREISQTDVDRALEDCRKLAIPSEREILHVIPQDFIIDGQDGITDPVGMSGVRMEANAHVITGLSTAVSNINRCVERTNLKVNDIVLEPLASSKSILTDEEKEVGVAMIDIGGGTTDVAIFKESIIRWTSVFGIAGRQVTDDIRHGLGILASQAERIKHQYGHAYIGSIHQDEVFMIPGIAGRNPIEINKSHLCQIIQPRMEEIFEFANAEIKRSGFKDLLGAGVVITGGSSLLKGTEELASHIFDMPVKMGIPSGITYSGLGPEIESPIYSTAVGLALYAKENNMAEEKKKEEIVEEDNENKPEANDKKAKKGTSFFKKIKGFIEDL